MLAKIGMTAAATLVAAGAVRGQWTWNEEAQLIASDAGVNDQFGFAAAVSGDTAVVGAWLDDNAGGADAGAAYVFVRSGMGWIEQQKLTASDGQPIDRFGYTVAVSGDTAVVGAHLDDNAGGVNAGAAYVFVRSGTSWSEQQRLVAVGGQSQDFFGWSVAVSGDTIVVGVAYDTRAAGNNAGSAYVFVRSGTSWSEQAQLVPSDAVSFDNFGYAVALSLDTAIVGSINGLSPGGTDDGSAYVFVRSGTSWSEQAKLTSTWGSGVDFGESVAVLGDMAVVGDPNEAHSGTNPGSAYVFVRNGTTWSEEARLTPGDPEQSLQFGASVAVASDLALIGAPFDDHAGGVGAGSAYVFERDHGGPAAWGEVVKLTASDWEDQDHFGRSVALLGDTAVIGAYLDDDAGVTDAGSAYALRLCPAGVTYCTAGTSAGGCQAAISAMGCASASASFGFELSATSVEGDKDGMFYFGTSGKQAMPWGNGTSLKCVAPPTKRVGLLAGSGTPGACDGAFAQDLNATWCLTCPKPLLNPGAGAVVQAQFWYRDPLSTSNQVTSLSDAIELGVGP